MNVISNALLTPEKPRGTPVAVAVAALEIVIVVAFTIVAIVAPPGIPAPETDIPTARSLVLTVRLEIVVLPFVVLPFRPAIGALATVTLPFSAGIVFRTASSWPGVG